MEKKAKEIQPGDKITISGVTVTARSVATSEGVTYILCDEIPIEDNTSALYRLALDTYGPEAQTVMVFEEMAELQKELCKHARGTDNLEAIAEEIADVQIMLEQMIELHGCEDAVLCYKRHKLERLAERIKKREDDSSEPVFRK